MLFTLTRRGRAAAALYVAVLTAAVGVAAGCGGGDDDSGLTREEYLAQGNAICAAGNERIEEIAAGLTGPPSGQEAVDIVNAVADDISGQVDEIAALDPPEELQADADALVAAARTGLEELRADPESLFGEESPLTPVNQMAAEMGLTTCAA
ncbi:MAG: hypothetical protein AB7V62_09895 [Thermoleophilia bacterium]